MGNKLIKSINYAKMKIGLVFKAIKRLDIATKLMLFNMYAASKLRYASFIWTNIIKKDILRTIKKLYYDLIKNMIGADVQYSVQQLVFFCGVKDIEIMWDTVKATYFSKLLRIDQENEMKAKFIEWFGIITDCYNGNDIERDEDKKMIKRMKESPIFAAFEAAKKLETDGYKNLDQYDPYDIIPLLTHHAIPNYELSHLYKIEEPFDNEYYKKIRNSKQRILWLFTDGSLYPYKDKIKYLKYPGY